MRKLLILFSFLSIVLSATAQNYYAVRIGSFVEVRPQDFDAVRPFGFVYATQAASNLYDVHVGGYNDRLTAEKALIEVKRKGYVNASVVEFAPTEGVSLTVIQLGVSAAGKPIDWERYMKAGEPYIIVGGENLKITTGAFPDMDTAREWLARIKKAGFADAFIRSVNSIFLQKAGDFETGIKKPLIPLVFEEAPKTSRPRPSTPRTTPATKATESGSITPVPETAPYGKEAPRSYEENSGWTVKSPQTPVITTKGVTEQPATTTRIASTPKAAAALPNIRGNVKRMSALELQRVLKAEGTYKSDLDGYYGPGTAGAYQASLESNRLIKKYALLAQHAGNSSDQLQTAINNLWTDALAPSVIETSKEPVALAYKAYLLFRNYGPDKQINTLMNNALRGAYSGKKLKGRAPFDYNATYAYEDLNQLILHIYYVHSAPGNRYSAPCWLNEEHPAESSTAQSIIAGYADAGFVLQACDQFSTWDDVRMLKAIAADLNAGDPPSGAVVSAAAARRSQLYLAPKALTAAQLKEAETWNARTWIGLNGWATRDPLNEQMVTAFKIVFYNSQVLLEDYFMDRGIDAEGAKGLALATLQTLVGPYVERFV